MKKITVIFFTLLISLSVYSQTITFADENFKNVLVNTLCVENTGDNIPDITADFNNDGEIQISEAEAILSLIIDDNSIVSLEGIKLFANLERLICNNTQITELDISEMVNLEVLACFLNAQLTDINLESLPSMREIYCAENNLYTVDASQTIAYDFNFSGNLNLSYINLRNGVHTDCVILLGQGVDYTCGFLLNLPALETVCVDDDEIFETSAPQENVMFVTDCLASIEGKQKDAMTIYPNPASSTIHFTNNKNIERINIYNTLGQTVKVIELNEKKEPLAFDVSYFNSGTYILEIISENKKIIKKFIKI